MKYNELSWTVSREKVLVKQVKILEVVKSKGTVDVPELFRLQNDTVNMPSARALAVRLITANRRGLTPGVDEESWIMDEEIQEALDW